MQDGKNSESRTHRQTINGSSFGASSIVENRLSALCLAAQRRDTTVWAIAFGTTLTPLLSDCATPGPHAFQANNASELNDVFARIAANMAKLRLSR